MKSNPLEEKFISKDLKKKKKKSKLQGLFKIKQSLHKTNWSVISQSPQDSPSLHNLRIKLWTIN